MTGGPGKLTFDGFSEIIPFPRPTVCLANPRPRPAPFQSNPPSPILFPRTRISEAPPQMPTALPQPMPSTLLHTSPTPALPIRIGPYVFDLPVRFHEGHTLTAREASAMNSLYAENVRNNVVRLLPARGEPMLSAGALAAVREEVQRYAEAYEFGGKKGSGVRTLGAFETTCREVAEERLAQLETSEGRRSPSDERPALLEKLAATATVQDEARARLVALRAVAEAGLESL